MTQPDESVLSLSDAFEDVDKPDVQVRVRMVNINRGHSAELQAQCRPLFEYSWLVGEVRDNQSRGMAIEEAIGAAINAMPQGYELRSLLAAHRAEVLDMLLTEYDEAREIELLKKSFREEGFIEGFEEKLARLLRDGLISAEQADRAKAQLADRSMNRGRRSVHRISGHTYSVIRS